VNPTIRGALASKTIWINVFLAVLSGLELMSSQITTMLGPKWAAGLVMLGALTNVGLRAYTSLSLAEKGQLAIDRKAEGQ
jgi:hypothetical protein